MADKHLNSWVVHSSYNAGGRVVARMSLRERQMLEVMESYVMRMEKSFRKRSIIEALNSFEVYRTDNGTVLMRGVLGYELAKQRANEIRKKYRLKWDDVKFRMERKKSSPPANKWGSSKGRVEYSNRYNPSKRTYFKGRYDSKGNWADLD